MILCNFVHKTGDFVPKKNEFGNKSRNPQTVEKSAFWRCMFPKFPKFPKNNKEDDYKQSHILKKFFLFLGTLGTGLKPLKILGSFCSQGFPVVWEHFGNAREDLHIFLLCRGTGLRG